MISYESNNHSKNPFILFKWLKNRIKFNKEHPFYFRPCSLVCYVGPQGSGKTLSAVLYVYKLMQEYPKAILVSNLELKDFPFDDKRVFFFQNGEDLIKHKNGDKGVIFLIDEIQLYFNSLQSKNINTDVMQVISQQRKQRIHIVSTSQVFGRMAKPLREQFSEVILCNCCFGNLQINKLIDRDSIEDFDNGTTLKGKVKKRFIFFHKPIYYELYDTYYVIKNNKFASGEDMKGVDIYDRNVSTGS